VLDRERSQIGVGREVGAHAAEAQQTSEHLAMTFGRLRNPGERTAQPFLDMLPGALDRFRLLENPRIGDKAQECQCHRDRRLGGVPTTPSAFDRARPAAPVRSSV
jgi:hypothetical protein